MNKTLEEESLELLCDMCNELSGAVNSLGGKKDVDVFGQFNFHCAKYVNHADEGFIFLRQAIPPRIAASKFLIRPIIEIMFRLGAIRVKPELLYRIAYAESQQDWKWFAPAAARLGQQIKYDRATHEQRWNDFTAKYREQFPSHRLIEKPVSTACLAAVAGFARYYDMYYRMYCRYTHGAFRAVEGSLDDLANPEDSRTMALCTLSALRALAPLDADMPNLSSLAGRLKNLDNTFIERAKQEEIS